MHNAEWAARGSAVDARGVACGENHEVLMTEGNPKGKRSAVNPTNLSKSSKTAGNMESLESQESLESMESVESLDSVDSPDSPDSPDSVAARGSAVEAGFNIKKWPLRGRKAGLRRKCSAVDTGLVATPDGVEIKASLKL
jgi:hypothetical protein